MNKKLVIISSIILMAVGGLFIMGLNTAHADTKPVYTISPISEPYQGNMANYSTYNHYTKHYYVIRSYLEQLEKTGGGTLILDKGTYTVTNTLYVPSNVTIKLRHGSVIKKGNKTGTEKISPAKSLFQFIKPSVAHNEAVYGKHNGEKNIRIIGSGNATIDLNYVKDSLAIIAGHNKNITINNIHFKHMHSGHFIEIDATKDAIIKNNTFQNSKPSKKQNKEAINIDTPDATTKGFGSKWSKQDKTPNVHLLIEENKFINLDRAIGTHKYSGDNYHDAITIRNNHIEQTRLDAIRVMNWSNAIIENNFIKDVAPGPNKDHRAILASGAHNPTFRNNVIVSTPRAIQFIAWKNSGPGSQYAITYNQLSETNIEDIRTNIIIDYEEDFIRINKKYKEYGKEYTDYIDIQTSMFYDLLQGENGYDEAMKLVRKGIINGYEDFTFKPYGNISREHVALMLARTKLLQLKKPEHVAEVVDQYTDIDSSYEYADEIATVSVAGIFGGSDGKFHPRHSITRGQMASVLVRTFALEDTGESVQLTDLDTTDPSHRDNVKILAQHHITHGKIDQHGEYYFDAGGKLNRIQFIQLLYRLLEMQQ